MKAVILAGGFGTRLRPFTFTRPKPMIPLLNKPVIEHVVDYLGAYGIKEIAVTTTYLREMIMEHLERRDDVQLSFPMEPEPLGTAGSVKNAGFDEEHEPFVVVQGDNITDLNLHDLLEFHHDTGGWVTIAVKAVEDPWHFGVTLLDERGCITRFQEKPPKGKCFSNLASTGIYVIDPKAMAYVPEGIPFDFAKDLFHLLHQKAREKLFGYPLKPGQFWADVGQVEGYMHATEWMLSMGRMDVLMGSNVEVDASMLVGPLVIGDGVCVEEGCMLGPRTVLFEDVDIGRDSCLQHSLVGEGTMIGEATYLRDATIGPHCILGNDVSVRNGTVWPFVIIPQRSTVNSTIKRFALFDCSADWMLSVDSADPERFFRTVSDEEAFYFNLSRNGKVSFTGEVAHSIREFLEIVKKIDLRSIEYHMGWMAGSGDFARSFVDNDIASWIWNVLGEEPLANAVVAMEPGDSRDQLVHMIQDWIEARQYEEGREVKLCPER
jgi:NDP-sugar pyrophosphorylase family protein